MLSHREGKQILARQVRPQATRFVLFLLLATVFTALAPAQDAPPPPPPPPPPPAQGAPGVQPPGPPPPPAAQPPVLAPQQLDPLVSRVALYPDPLLAQVLTAATFPEEIPDAANWSNEHSTLPGDALANAISADNLPWDPSVLALLPFPSVLNMMAQDPGWTQSLGDAVLVQRPDVMDAVQRMRQQAYNFGYLRPTPYDNVINSGGYIAIAPVNPAYIYPPIYNPAVVFVAPRPGFVISAGIHFGPSVVIGPAFAPFGWVGVGIGWNAHTLLIGGSPWGRTWANRSVYVHPYARAFRPGPGPRVESHAVRPAARDDRNRPRQ